MSVTMQYAKHIVIGIVVASVAGIAGYYGGSVYSTSMWQKENETLRTQLAIAKQPKNPAPQPTVTNPQNNEWTETPRISYLTKNSKITSNASLVRNISFEPKIYGDQYGHNVRVPNVPIGILNGEGLRYWDTSHRDISLLTFVDGADGGGWKDFYYVNMGKGNTDDRRSGYVHVHETTSWLTAGETTVTNQHGQTFYIKAQIDNSCTLIVNKDGDQICRGSGNQTFTGIMINNTLTPFATPISSICLKEQYFDGNIPLPCDVSVQEPQMTYLGIDPTLTHAYFKIVVDNKTMFYAFDVEQGTMKLAATVPTLLEKTDEINPVQ